jgi:hypothetical protein
MTKGRLIGKGWTAEVYEWEKDKVLKLYYDWVSQDLLEHEANIGTTLNTVEVPAPYFYEKVSESGRAGLIFQRFGKSMFKLIDEEPWKIVHYAKKMARLHYEIHLGKGGALPSQKEKLSDAIKQSKELLGEKTDPIIQYLDSLPSGDNVCHGDFHPDNILISGQNVVAIDWFYAYSGNPISDVAKTCIMLSSPSVPPGFSSTRTILFRFVKRLIYSPYTKEYLKLTGKVYRDIDSWLLPMAAARLKDKLPGEEKWLLGIIDEKLKGLLKYH